MAEHTGEIRQGWQALYPYESHSMTIGGFRYNYVDEGPTEPDGVDRPTLICVHGNPTWSFFFRGVVNAFRDKRAHYEVRA